MTEHRKALHDLVDKAPEQELPELLIWLTSFLQPPESSGASEFVTFFPAEPETTATESTTEAESDRVRQQLTNQTDVERTSELVRKNLLHAVERLGLSLEGLPESGGQSASLTASGTVELNRHWWEGTLRNRISTFSLQGQEVITFERARVSPAASELIYKVRVLTPQSEAEGELHIPFQ